MLHLSRRHSGPGLPGAVVVVLSTGGLLLGGCVSSGSAPVGPERLAEGVDVLARPLPGDLAALYNLRVSKTGGLRLAVATADDRGRLTVSEPFGSAVSMTAWASGSPSIFFDMREGCQREVEDLEEVLGVAALPLGQAVRLLGGRLPALEDDEVTVEDSGAITVRGVGWAASVRLAEEPWRVLEVAEVQHDGARGWRLVLDDHTSSVPGEIRLEHPDGRWAELALTRLEWPNEVALPELPVFPACAGR
jgi:hypothetical protein